MKYKLIKKFILMMTVMVLCFSSVNYADFYDVPENADYAKSIRNLSTLGIIKGNENGKFSPNDTLTREQFAKVIVKIADLEDRADEMKFSSTFSDISNARWSTGYIEAAVKSGYINGKLDGRFHPEQSITYAEACTAMVKVLGYSSDDLKGIWPDNYISEADNIGISKGVSFSPHESLPRWAVAVMLDNLMNSPIKSNPNLLLSEVNELYTDCIILETVKTSASVTENEVVTDKGIFYICQDIVNEIILEPGKRYRVEIVDDVITKIYSKLSSTNDISVERFSGTTVTYRAGNKLKSIILPSKTKYYYNGRFINHEQLPQILNVYSSIVLSLNDNGAGYEYGVIYDPIYSEPVIAKNINLISEVFGDINLGEEIRIDRNGELVRTTEIEKNDVVYKVSDIWEKNKYIHVVDTKIEGEITAFVPKKISPKYVEIDDISYELSKDIDFEKITKQGIYEVQDIVTLLLGYDGKVVDIYINSDEDNHEFALVIDDYSKTSTSIEDFGNEIDYVKLLHIDGTTKIYRKQDDNNYNGQLVKYKIIETENDDTDKVILEELEYLSSKGYKIDKDEKKLDDSYFSDNVKIFNLVHNIYGADSYAYIIDVDDLPNGSIKSGKIKYINKAGAFKDINVMLVEDILDEGSRLGIVTNTHKTYNFETGTIYTSKILINGIEYITSHHVSGMGKGDIVDVEVLNNNIISVKSIKNPLIQSSSIQAIDSGRIKVNNRIYKFSDDIAIYFRDAKGEYNRKGTNDLVSGEDYGRISIYIDKSTKYGGKVELIVVGY